jgi:uncharacterized protein (DUF58 family)
MAVMPLNPPTAPPDQQELQRLARIADRLFAGRPRILPGNRPHRLRAGQGIEFMDHREYLPGDSLRDIDWRASARSRQHQVRRFSTETSADWFICLDRSASMSLHGNKKWALALRLTAALAYLLIHLDNRVGLILFSHRVDGMQPLGRGRQTYAAILQLLQTMPPAVSGGGSALKACGRHIRPGCQIIAVSDFLVPGGMRNDLSLLAAIAEQTQAIQVLEAPAELQTGDGYITLQDIESREQARILLSPAAREKLGERMLQLVAELRAHCLRYRISFSSCNTSEHWREVLLGHIMGLGARGV